MNEHFTEYTHENGADILCVFEDGHYECYTSGTTDALYSGADEGAARHALEWDEETWNRVLMSDGVVCEVDRGAAR